MTAPAVCPSCGQPTWVKRDDTLSYCAACRFCQVTYVSTGWLPTYAEEEVKQEINDSVEPLRYDEHGRTRLMAAISKAFSKVLR